MSPALNRRVTELCKFSSQSLLANPSSPLDPFLLFSELPPVCPQLPASLSFWRRPAEEEDLTTGTQRRTLPHPHPSLLLGMQPLQILPRRAAMAWLRAETGTGLSEIQLLSPGFYAPSSGAIAPYRPTAGSTTRLHPYPCEQGITVMTTALLHTAQIRSREHSGQSAGGLFIPALPALLVWVELGPADQGNVGRCKCTQSPVINQSMPFCSLA